VASVVLRWGGECYALDTPATGVMNIEEMSEHVIQQGTLEATLVSTSGAGEQHDVEVDFQLDGQGHSEGFEDLVFENLCEAE
jgi:hypothetical protein